MITLRYSINGCKFKRRYALVEHEAARIRVDTLRENGVSVRVKGFPRRLTLKMPPPAAR